MHLIPKWKVDIARHDWLAEAARYSPSTRRRCSSRISSAMLVRESRTSSAKGAFGRHDLSIGRAPRRRLVLGSFPTLILHLAAIEAHT